MARFDSKPRPTAKAKPVRKKTAKRATRRSSSASASLSAIALVPAEPTRPVLSSFSLAHVSFEDALQLTPLFELTIQVARQRFETNLRSELIAAGVITANARVFLDESTLAVRFTHNGVRGLSRGGFRLMQDAAGRQLPVLTNASGRIVSHARVASQLASRAASLGAMVVGAAHLISGADLAARLKEMQRDVRFLVAARTHDKLGRLEAIYSHARELLAGPQTPEIELEIFRQTRELVEVRAQWRRDVHAKLECIEDPAEQKGVVNWLRHTFAKGAEKDAKKLHADTTDALTELRWIDFSLALQYAISSTCGREQPFLQLTLPDEVRAIERLAALVAEKTMFLKDHDAHVDREAISLGFKSMVDRYTLLARAIPAPAV